MASTYDGLFVGATQSIGSASAPEALVIPTHQLTTHAVVLGMTGSGKTGLVVVMIEEAARAGVPVLVLDVKGDLANLALALPDFSTASLAPWLESAPQAETAEMRAARLERAANDRREGLQAWGIDEVALSTYATQTEVRVITPGADAGELLHVLSSLERRSSRWDHDAEGARAALSAAVSLILRILGRDADPARSREHVLLAVLAERRLAAGGTAAIPELLTEILEPPIDKIGALEVDDFIPKKARKELAAALNALLASPSFASWREGATLDVAAWMTPRTEPGGKTPITIVSVAHLDDDERALVLGVVLEEILAWVRDLPGSQALRGLVVFDEVYGFLPPHPANPPTKRPIVALMKQARAFGVGVVIATQNPMDVDYRALSNAGLWCLGRLQTDADRARVVDALTSSAGGDSAEIAGVLKRLTPRWFLVRNARAGGATRFLQPRWAMSLLRGPMTRSELRRLRDVTTSRP